MQDVRASSLRFTVYTRDEADGGSIVELLNTGMIGLGRFSDEEESSIRSTSSEGGKELVLDFEDDVRGHHEPILAFGLLLKDTQLNIVSRALVPRGLRLLLVLLALLLVSLL